jgi:hypothetical protein
MRRRPRQGFFSAMVQLFGLESLEQGLIDSQLAFHHRAQRARFRVYRALPVVAVATVLVVYAAGAVTLAARRIRAGAAAREAEPLDGAPAGGATTAEIAV